MNRTLKRPMFRIGGPVNQGSGIMSHVEPKRHYVMGGRVGFRTGTIPGFQNQIVTPQDESGLDILLRNYGANNLDIQQSGLNSIRGDTNTEDNTSTNGINYAKQSTNPLVNTYKKIYEPETNFISKFINYNKDINKYLRDTGKINEKSTPSEILQARKEYQEDYRKKQSEPPAGATMEFGNPEGDKVWNTSDKPVEKKEPEYTDTTKTDPKAEIRKDAALLKELLHGEDYQDMTKGEVALVLARALAEPGPIGNKLKVASELSIPLMKAKKGEDKEAVLEAYKAYREREKAEITAGRQGVLEKDARALTAAYIAAHGDDPDTKTAAGRAKIYQEKLNERLSGEGKLSEKVRAAAFTGIQQTLETKVNTIRKTEADIAAGKKLSKSDLETHEENKNYVRSMKDRFPEYFTSIYGNKLAKGGRVKLADGTEDPDTTTEDGTTTDDTVESTTTSADAGTPQTQLKPVVKLSFQELRSRLPKEITNDIVGMLASSEEALQDFAYIKTQQDVNNFNVKYGVNLVLPSNR